jgi:hypothetical protein
MQFQSPSCAVSEKFSLFTLDFGFLDQIVDSTGLRVLSIFLCISGHLDLMTETPITVILKWKAQFL